MTELDQLLKKAKEAQRAYDVAKEAKVKAEAKHIKKGSLVASSKEDGEFEWKCNAQPDQIIGHVVNTIKSAISSFNSVGGDEAVKGKIMLALAIIEKLKVLSKEESSK